MTKKIFDNGDFYDGTVKNYLPHGKGDYLYSNKDFYTGDFVNGVATGKGVFKWADGDTYTGDFVNDSKTGKGIFKWTSGSVYEGDFVKGKKHGKGVFRWANGDIYTGDFVNDSKTGKGVFRWADGDTYTGDFVNDSKTGKGIFKWTSGSVYEGDFVKGDRHGKGVFKWLDGDVYEGDFVDGKRTGYGIYKWANGDVYEGDFVDGKRTGYGIFYEKNFKKYKTGFWIDTILLDEVVSQLINSGDYAKALILCREKYFEFSKDSNKENNVPHDFEAPEIDSYENHYDRLSKKIENLEKEIINAEWVAFTENPQFQKIPYPAYQSIEVPLDAKREFPDILKIGTLNSGVFKTVKLPLLIPFSDSSGLSFIVETKESRNNSEKAIQLIAFRLLFSIPDGKCKFFIIDPVNSGQSFSGLFGLDQRILEKEIWDDNDEIRNGLSVIKNSIPSILTGLLTTKYKNLIEYNKLVNYSKQPFQFLLIANFPRGFTQESASLLLSILKNGTKAGVYCLMSIDYSCPKPYNEFRFDEFRNISIEWDFKENKILNSVGIDIINKFDIEEIDFQLPEGLEYQKEIINKNLNKAIKIELETIPKNLMWKQSSARGITIPIGMSVDGKQMNLQLGDGSDVYHALIGGATGKGKTILLHNLIINGSKLYHPDELQFILMDYKEGTEFNVYRSLPHLKVLTVSSEIEFGISVIEFLSEEIVKRGNLFKSTGVGDFSEYKISGKGQLPRYLIIMDEFQVLLNPQKRTTYKIASMIEDLARRGRSFGINMILSTQSLGDVELSASTLGQMGVRIAMSMPANDCVRILNIDNDLPVTFTKAGQAVYNNSLGQKEGNIIFQVAFIEKSNISNELSLIPFRDDEKYITNQFIFDGNTDVYFENNSEFTELVKNNNLKINDLFSDIFIGEPFYLSNKHSSFRIRKQQESNLLIIGDDPKAAISISYFSLYQLALQSSKDSKLFVLDMFSVDGGLQGGFNNLKDLGLNLSIYTQVKATEEVIGLIKTELNLRIVEEGSQGRIILCLMNINSVRQLKRSDYTMSPLTNDLFSIIKDGPEFGIHTIIHALDKKSLEQIFESNIYSEFENIIVLKGSNPSEFGSDMDEVVKKENTAFLISPNSKYGADKIKIYKL